MLVPLLAFHAHGKLCIPEAPNDNSLALTLGRLLECLNNSQVTGNQATGGGIGPDVSTAPVRVTVEPRTPTQDFTSGDSLVLEVTLYDALQQVVNPIASKDVTFVSLSSVDGRGNQLNLLGSPVMPSKDPSLISLPSLLKAPGSADNVTITATMLKSGITMGKHVVGARLSVTCHAVQMMTWLVHQCRRIP